MQSSLGHLWLILCDLELFCGLAEHPVGNVSVTFTKRPSEKEALFFSHLGFYLEMASVVSFGLLLAWTEEM